MTWLRGRHNQHGEYYEEYRQSNRQAEECLLYAPSGAVYGIGLPEYAAKAASVNLQKDDRDKGHSNQHLAYS
jgi:hypothetical protein